MRAALCSLLLAAVVAPATHAQDVAVLIPFDVVKLRSPELDGHFSVVSLKEGTLRLRGIEDTSRYYSVPVASIRKVELSLGEHTKLERAGIGTMRGLLVGSLVGIVIGASNGRFRDGGMTFNGGVQVLTAGGLFAGVGAIAGVVVGDALQSNKWERVPLVKLGGGTAGATGGSLGFSIRF